MLDMTNNVIIIYKYSMMSLASGTRWEKRLRNDSSKYSTIIDIEALTELEEEFEECRDFRLEYIKEIFSLLDKMASERKIDRSEIIILIK